MSIDVNRIATSAIEALLDNGDPSDNGHEESEHHHLGTVAAVALGIALAAGGRAVYSRARHLDLEQVADAVENRLTGDVTG